jgi:hypothetical protein
MVTFWSRISVAVVLLVPCSLAAEVVHLDNGNDLHCVRHEQMGGATRLYLDEAAFIEMPSPQISGYEADLESGLPETPQPIPSEFPKNAGKRLAADAAIFNDGRSRPTIREHVEEAARQTGVDPDFIESVIRIESGYNAEALSPKGARGLMQLMPSTAASLGVQDSFNPGANIDGGSRYLRDLLLRYDGDAIKALAAYNAGPERVEQYNGVPPFRETRSYVARVIKDFNRRKLSGPGSAAKKIDGSAKRAKKQSSPARTSKALGVE